MPAALAAVRAVVVREVVCGARGAGARTAAVQPTSRGGAAVPKGGPAGTAVTDIVCESRARWAEAAAAGTQTEGATE
eukprot:4503125-Prymnesium_polylepis.1